MLEKFYNHSLKSLNTFGFDVSTRCLMQAHTTDEILQAISSSDFTQGNHLIMGGGSNLLFTKNFDGCIIQPLLQNIDIVENGENSVLLRVGAGVVWDNLVAYCVKQNWYGLENLSLIPGNVGASPVQNIGAYGAEAKDCIEKVQYIDIQTLTVNNLSNEACQFAYRNSIFKQELKGKIVITQVYFRLRKNAELQINYGNLAEAVASMGSITLVNVRKAVLDIRRSKLPDPAETGNAGSFFKNPFISNNLYAKILDKHPAIPNYPAENGVKIPAGWLIEQCGFKGARRGSVGVHPKQALVLVNYGGGTGNDILALAKEICEGVKAKFGVELEMEVNVV